MLPNILFYVIVLLGALKVAEKVNGSFTVELYCEDNLLCSEELPITVLTFNEWSGARIFPELLAASDVVTLHIPLWPENRDFADAAFFSQMRPGASFFNASRGEVVDEDALLAARPRLDKLVLDVWKNEPAINRALLAAADIATPHIAGYSIQGKINGTQAVVRAVGETFGIDPLRQFSVTGVSLPQEPYDIFRDDAALRRDPSAFESIRSHYAYRNDQLKTLS